MNLKIKKNIIKKYYENPKNVYGFGHKKIYFEIIKALQNKKIKQFRPKIVLKV